MCRSHNSQVQGWAGNPGHLLSSVLCRLPAPPLWLAGLGMGEKDTWGRESSWERGGASKRMTWGGGEGGLLLAHLLGTDIRALAHSSMGEPGGGPQ